MRARHVSTAALASLLTLSMACGTPIDAVEVALPLNVPVFSVLDATVATPGGDVEISLLLGYDAKGKVVNAGSCTVDGVPVTVKGSVQTKDAVAYRLALKGDGVAVRIAGVLAQGASSASVTYRGPKGKTSEPAQEVQLVAAAAAATLALEPHIDAKGKITGTGTIIGAYGDDADAGVLKGKLANGMLKWVLKSGTRVISFKGAQSGEDAYVGVAKLKLPPTKSTLTDFEIAGFTGSGPGSGPRPETFDRVGIEPELDAARATTAAVGPTGGQVAARAADGAVYRLDVPPNALSEAVEITVTPVTSIAGLPLSGGLLAAVQLEPSGLVFRVPAALTFELPDAVAADLAGFAWSGPGNEFAIAPWWLAPDRSSVQVEVAHFSGYGIAIPGPTELDPIAGELLLLQGEQGIQVVALNDCFQGIVACSDADWDSMFRDWYDIVVAPRLAAGSTSVADAIAGHVAFRDWAAFLVLVQTPEGMASLPPVLASRHTEGRAANLANLLAHFESHTRPACNGAAVDWKDFLRVPDQLTHSASQLYQGAELDAFEFSPSNEFLGEVTGNACVRLAFDEIEFPESLPSDATEIALSFRTVIEVSGSESIGVRSAVTFEYSDGAVGPVEILTDADGTATVLVERDPFISTSLIVTMNAVEAELGLPVFLSAIESVETGLGEIFFEENLSTSPRPVLASGSTHEFSIFVRSDPAAGQEVQLSLDGPGLIDGGTEALTLSTGEFLGIGIVNIAYTAPDYAVAKDVVARITATATFGGATHTDTLVVRPHWVGLSLEADLGSGFVDASGQSLTIVGDGPYALRALLTEAGPTVSDPPQPLSAPLGVETAEETLSSDAVDCCASILTDVTDADGYFTFAWQAHGSGANQQSITVRYVSVDSQGTTAGFIETSTSLLREASNAVASVALPSKVEPGVPFEVEIYVENEESEDALGGLLLELSAEGGTVATNVGTTNEDGIFRTSAEIDPAALGFKLHVLVSDTTNGAILTESSGFTIRSDFAGVWVGTSRRITQSCTDLEASTSETTAAFAIIAAGRDGIVASPHYSYGTAAWSFEEFRITPSGTQLSGTIARWGIRYENGTVQAGAIEDGSTQPFEGELLDGLLSVRTSSGYDEDPNPWCEFREYELRHESEFAPIDLSGTWSFTGSQAENGYQTIEITIGGPTILGTLTHEWRGQTPVHGRVWGNRVIGIWSESGGLFPAPGRYWGILDEAGNVLSNRGATVLVR